MSTNGSNLGPMISAQSQYDRYQKNTYQLQMTSIAIILGAIALGGIGSLIGGLAACHAPRAIFRPALGLPFAIGSFTSITTGLITFPILNYRQRKELEDFKDKPITIE